MPTNIVGECMFSHHLTKIINIKKMFLLLRYVKINLIVISICTFKMTIDVESFFSFLFHKLAIHIVKRETEAHYTFEEFI